ncbi:MAG: DUF1801 domain-containing protein [Bacteroidia bacterium]|nr:DUF1801 domain-containing protein [Bacteroidia bacterium]
MIKSRVPSNIDEYISGFPEPVQKRLKDIRAAIKKAAPEAREKISYQMPSFTMDGVLVYFAAHSNHIGFYPLTTGIEAFKEELSGYQTSKGTIQFPHNKPLPLSLITKIVKFRAVENLAKAKLKAKK